jgi:membrane-associated phospholipid phosphatase
MALFALQQLDFLALKGIQAMANPLLTAAMLAITFLGSPVFWVGISAALYWRGQENRGFFLMNLVLFTAAVVGAVKHAVARPRPSPDQFRVLGSDAYVNQGFPSGHSAIIAAAFAYTCKMLDRHKKALFAAAVLLVAFSRLYLGMHFPTDVIAGIALGYAIGKANLFARNKLFHRNFKPSKLQDELALVALVGAGILAIMFLRSVPMAGLFIGFYAGFFLFKEKGLSQSILMRKALAAKYALGFAVLLAMFLAGENIVHLGMAFTEMQLFAMYILGGLWISLIWPVLFEKAFKAGG